MDFDCIILIGKHGWLAMDEQFWSYSIFIETKYGKNTLRAAEGLFTSAWIHLNSLLMFVEQMVIFISVATRLAS